MVVWVIEKLGMAEIQESDTVKKNWIHGMRNQAWYGLFRQCNPTLWYLYIKLIQII